MSQARRRFWVTACAAVALVCAMILVLVFMRGSYFAVWSWPPAWLEG